METQEETIEERLCEGDCGDYEDYVPPTRRRRKQRDREREYTAEFVKVLSRHGARTKRYRDQGWLNPYDGFVFYKKFMSFEAKFLEGRKTFNIDTWVKSQPHQMENLRKDFEIGASPFLLIFWKESGRIRICVEPFAGISYGGKLVLSEIKILGSGKKMKGVTPDRLLRMVGRLI